MANFCKRIVSLAPVLSHTFRRRVCHPATFSTSSFKFSDISTKPEANKKTVSINFSKTNGEKQSVQAKIGDSLLDVIVDNDIDIDGFGACEGTLACSTCHLVFSKEDYKKLPEEPIDEELDMLDLAYGLTETSRLGCQVIVSTEMEGWEIKVPEGVADARDT